MLVVVLDTEGLSQRNVTVRVDRWLLVRQMTGRVTFSQQNTTRPAQVGDRLQAVGDGIQTGDNSSSRLELDTGIGFVNVTQNTQMFIQSLDYASDNGRITRLRVPQGQVRLQVRPFTHRGSQLEIETPSGVSGVRGTDFGLAVQPDGKTGLATLNGRVTSSAQGRTVMVAEGYQNFTIPGEPPSPPVPLRDNTDLQYRVERLIEGGVRRVRIIGQVDPVNAVRVGDVPVSTDRNGQFVIERPGYTYIRLQVTVTTPLGREQRHDLRISL